MRYDIWEASRDAWNFFTLLEWCFDMRIRHIQYKLGGGHGEEVGDRMRTTVNVWHYCCVFKTNNKRDESVTNKLTRHVCETR